MKISQLDYSAMINANSAVMAAEANAQNNRAISMADSINKMNQSNLERTSALQAKAQEIQANANKANAIANIINAGLNVVASGADIYNSIKQAKIENDTAAWNLSKLQNVTDFQTLIATADNLGSFNDQGEFEISNEISDFIYKVVSDIKASDWTKDVKDLAIQEWAQIGSAASVSIAQEYGARQKQSKATLEGLELQEIQKAEIITGSGYEAGYNFINNLSYDDTTKEALRLNYKNGVDEGRRQETALATLSTSGYNAARDYVNSLTGITETERRNLLSTISTQYESQTTNDALAAGNLFADCLANGMTAADAREAVMKELGAYSQDADYQQAIKTVIDTAQITYAVEQYPTYSQLDYLTASGLDLLYESIEQDEKGVFAGIENTQQTMLATVNDQRIALDSAALGSAETDVSQLETNFDNLGNAAVNLFKAGSLSANSAVQEIEKAEQTLLSDVHAIYDPMLADGTITPEQYEKAMTNISARAAKSKAALLTQCVVANVPAQYQDYIKTSISDTLYSHFGDKSFDKLNDAQKAEWKSLETSAMLKAIEYTKANATNDMNINQWNDFLKELSTEILYKEASLITDIAMDKRSIVTETADGSVSYKNLSDVMDLAYGAEDAIYEYPTGGFEFTNRNWETTYNDVADLLGSELSKRGIVSESESQKIMTQPMRDSNGDLIPFPTITVDDRTYSLQENSDGTFSVFYVDDSGSWGYLPYSSIKPLKSTGLADDGIPNGSVGDLIRNPEMEIPEEWKGTDRETLLSYARNITAIRSNARTLNEKLSEEVPEDNKNRLENYELWKLDKNTPKGI